MKIIFLSIGLLLSVGTMALAPRDTVKINDLWVKKDTTEQLKKLEKDQEMQLFDQTEKRAGREVRTLSGETARKNQRSGSSGQEIEVYGNSRYKKTHKYPNYRRFRGHWCGVNIGFLNVANTDYAGYEGYEGFMDPDYSRSFTLQANIFEESINLVPRNNFGLVVGLGLEYQHMQMDNENIAFRRGEDKRIEPYHLNSSWDVKKNYFKNIYLTVPLLAELQIPAKYSKRFYVSAGVVGGVRLHTKTKLVYYNENGNKKKKKKNDHYNVQPIKADLMANVGYGCFHFWGTYTLTELFRNGKGPEIHPYSFGVGIAF